MENQNTGDWESKITINGHQYGNAKNENGTKENEDSHSTAESQENADNVDSERGMEQNPKGQGGNKPEDPETKGITEGDTGYNPGSQDGNRGTGKTHKTQSGR